MRDEADLHLKIALTGCCALYFGRNLAVLILNIEIRLLCTWKQEKEAILHLDGGENRLFCI